MYLDNHAPSKSRSKALASVVLFLASMCLIAAVHVLAASDDAGPLGCAPVSPLV